jgi:hypothetical protein
MKRIMKYSGLLVLVVLNVLMFSDLLIGHVPTITYCVCDFENDKYPSCDHYDCAKLDGGGGTAGTFGYCWQWEYPYYIAYCMVNGEPVEAIPNCYISNWFCNNEPDR